MYWISVVTILLVVGILAGAWIRKITLTYALIFANLMVLVLQIITDDVFSDVSRSILTEDLAFRTRYLVYLEWDHMHTVLSAAFLHAGLMHFIGNALVLFLAGIPFEERLGRGRFLALYLFSAVAATLIHGTWTYFMGTPAHWEIPALGASGAVFGILGGFATAYPNDKFPVFPIPLLVFTFFARNVPVLLGVLLMIAIEGFFLFSAGHGLTGVANAAHVGGAIGGTVAALVLKRSVTTGVAAPTRTIDYPVLERLATDDKSRGLVQKVRENSDTKELQQAWLDRLVVRLRCAECGQGFAEMQPGVLECERGHRVKYVR